MVFIIIDSNILKSSKKLIVKLLLVLTFKSPSRCCSVKSLVLWKATRGKFLSNKNAFSTLDNFYRVLNHKVFRNLFINIFF